MGQLISNHKYLRPFVAAVPQRHDNTQQYLREPRERTKMKIQILTLLLLTASTAFQFVNQSNKAIVFRVVPKWDKLKQSACFLFFTPSVLCAPITTNNNNNNNNNDEPQQEGQSSEPDNSYSETTDRVSTVSTESSFDQATNPIKQRVWLGLRH